jgi:hypothetical protein
LTSAPNYWPTLTALTHIQVMPYVFRVFPSSICLTLALLVAGLSPAAANAAEPQTTITYATPDNTGGVSSDGYAGFAFESDVPAASFECRVDGATWDPCVSMAEYYGLADGSHTFEVRAVDLSYVTGPADSRSFSVAMADVMPPQTFLNSSPQASTTQTSATLSFSADEPATFSCQLDGGSWDPCTSPQTYSGLALGPHSFAVLATDLAGNDSWAPAQASWTVVVPPTVTVSITSTPPSPATAGFPISYGWTTTGPVATTACGFGLMSGTVVADQPCSSPATMTPGAPGTYRFVARVCDAGTPVSCATTSRPISVVAATEPPDTQIFSGPYVGETVTSGDVSFTYAATFAGSTFECQLDSGMWVGCDTQPQTYTGLADGPHSFAVRASKNGFTDASPKTVSFVVARPDVTAPQTTITSGVSEGETVPVTAVSVGFGSSEAGSSFECQLDAGSWHACNSPLNLSGLADGGHTVAVRATDAAGNTDPSPATRSFTISVPPSTSILTGPAEGSTSLSDSEDFTYIADQSGSTFSCSMDGGPYVACDSQPHTLNGLAAGPHTFTVRATNPAAVAELTPPTRSWTTPDVVAPQTSITDAPADGATLAVAGTSVSFVSSEALSSFECRLDAGAWEVCSSPKSLSDLSIGSHIYEVRATDQAGNTDPTPASRAFNVSVLPDTTITAGPSGTISTASTDFFFASDPTASFECRLDAGAWTPCSSPDSLDGLSDGPHVFETRAVNAQGVDPSPAQRSFTVAMPAPAPETTITVAPTSILTVRHADLSFVSDQVGSTFQCRLDGHAWAACSSPKTLTALSDGMHFFDVRALNVEGTADPSPAHKTIVVAAPPTAVGPNTTITAGPDSTIATRTTTISFMSDQGDSSFDCRLDAGAWTACSSPMTLTGLNDGDHTFQVRAIGAVADETPAQISFVVAVPVVIAAPNTTITVGPTGTVTTSAVDFQLSSDQPASSFQCHLDAGAWAPCTSPAHLAGLAAGAHIFEARADNANGTDLTPAAATFTVQAPAVPAFDVAVASTAHDNVTAGESFQLRGAVTNRASLAGKVSWSFVVPAGWTAVSASGGDCQEPVALDGASRIVRCSSSITASASQAVKLTATAPAPQQVAVAADNAPQLRADGPAGTVDPAPADNSTVWEFVVVPAPLSQDTTTSDPGPSDPGPTGEGETDNTNVETTPTTPTLGVVSVFKPQSRQILIVDGVGSLTVRCNFADGCAPATLRFAGVTRVTRKLAGALVLDQVVPPGATRVRVKLSKLARALLTRAGKHGVSVKFTGAGHPVTVRMLISHTKNAGGARSG